MHVYKGSQFSVSILTEGQFWVIPMRTIPASRNRKSCLGSVPTVYDFRSMQFSDTLMSDGYFHISYMQTLMKWHCRAQILDF